MSTTTVDAVVIGSGPNGLVAANALVDAGWEVLVLEAQDTIGGAVRSAEVTAPGFSTDLFSAFYPLAAASPVIRDLDLDQHGLRWISAPTALAHVLGDGRSAVLSTDLEADDEQSGRVRCGRRPRRGPKCLRSGSGSEIRCWTRCSPPFRRSGRPCNC